MSAQTPEKSAKASKGTPKETPKAVEETPKETPQETPAAIDLAEYAKAGTDSFISTSYANVEPILNQLHVLEENLAKYTPPSAGQVNDFVKSEQGQMDPEISERDKRRREIIVELQRLEREITERARRILQPETIPFEQLEQMRKDFASQRDVVSGQLGAMKIYVHTMQNSKPELQGLDAAIDNFKLPRVPYGLGSTGSSSGASSGGNPETAAIKKWADENGETYPSRGRLPQSLVDKYNAATGNKSAA
jgi:Lsr2 protein